MLYRLRDVPAMLATPGGRAQVKGGALFRLWPLLSRLAEFYRRTVVRRTRVVVVVGSFGKSTTTRAVAAALRLPEHPHMLSNAFTAVALALLRIGRSQPRAVIEAGIAAPGEMARYARMIRPDITVVTSVGSEHAPRIGTLDDIRNEKSQMVRALPASGAAVLNGDDPRVMWMAGATGARIVTYGFGAACDVRASELRIDWPAGSRFRVAAFGRERDVSVRLVGRHMMYPVLAAIAVSQIEGLDLDDTLTRLQSLPPTPRRMQPFALAGGVVLLLDDFKSTLETMHAALEAFAEVPARRRIVLFGDVTEPPVDRVAVYRQLGARIAGIAAHLVVFGRGLQDYTAGATQAGMQASAIHDGGNSPQQAVAALRALLQPGDVVLIKGRKGQALDRVRLLLQGDRVGCEVGLCDVGLSCAQCPALSAGWGTRRMVLRRGLTP